VFLLFNHAEMAEGLLTTFIHEQELKLFVSYGLIALTVSAIIERKNGRRFPSSSKQSIRSHSVEQLS